LLDRKLFSSPVISLKMLVLPPDVSSIDLENVYDAKNRRPWLKRRVTLACSEL
jgi:hypothetical protein